MASSELTEPPVPGPGGIFRQVAERIEQFSATNPFLRALRALRELVVLLLSLLVFIVPSASAPLQVVYSFDEMLPPAAAAPFLVSSTDRQPPERVAAAVLSSPLLLRIEIRNRTQSPITDVDLTVTGVRTVAGDAVRSDSRADPGVATYLLGDHTLSFPHLREVPPGALIEILVWGEFAPFQGLSGGSPIRVLSSAARTSVTQEIRSSGVGGFIDANAFWITTIATIMLLLVGLKRLYR